VNRPTVQYTAKTRAAGGRSGSTRSDDGRLDVTLSVPGTRQRGTNPEQLFAAGWSACFLSAVRQAAGVRRIRLPAGLELDAEVDLCNSGGEYFLQARLTVRMPGLERDLAQQLVEAAHQICPYSRAIRGNIPVVITVA
jgi:Ohr subfamily peroxiredoxin